MLLTITYYSTTVTIVNKYCNALFHLRIWSVQMCPKRFLTAANMLNNQKMLDQNSKILQIFVQFRSSEGDIQKRS